jgi:hypothetical protein
MGMGEKGHQEATDERFKKVLNKNDPFDQLILSLAKTGTLDVTIVGIDSKGKEHSEREYSRKPLPHHGKHSS